MKTGSAANRKQQKRGVKVRPLKYKSRGKEMTAHQISVPNEIAKRVPAGARFVVELTDDGILFRLIKPPPKLPGWAVS